MITSTSTTSAPHDSSPSEQPLVLYDGVCGLCAKSVRWILRHERDHELRFAPLQGRAAAVLRAKHSVIPETLESVVYVAGDKAYVRSKAFLHLSRHLRAPWRWLHAFRWLPGVILDLPYRLVAATRYRIFGKSDACELPSPEQRARFLD
jgi:predicted DCC family thiol-disulfide oxidoreductase YuxK